MRLYNSYYILLFISFSLVAQRISIIIPCHPKHVRHLDNLLHVYEQQTLLPDEIIIAISGINAVRDSIQELAKQQWIFPIKILTSTNMLRAGENRNRACQQANGDIFICQDADDIPHPQRVEIIHYFFEKYKLDHLLHKWDIKQNWQIIKDFDQIPFVYPNNFWIEAMGTGDYTQGNPAISKELFNIHTWSNESWGEDTHYNQKAYELTKNRMLIPLILYHYRSGLSASRTMETSHLYYPVIIEE